MPGIDAKKIEELRERHRVYLATGVMWDGDDVYAVLPDLLDLASQTITSRTQAGDVERVCDMLDVDADCEHALGKVAMAARIKSASQMIRSLSSRVEEAERERDAAFKSADDNALAANAAETRSAALARALGEAKTGLTLTANDFRDLARHLTEEPRDMALAARETAMAFIAKIDRACAILEPGHEG